MCVCVFLLVILHIYWKAVVRNCWSQELGGVGAPRWLNVLMRIIFLSVRAWCVRNLSRCWWRKYILLLLLPWWTLDAVISMFWKSHQCWVEPRWTCSEVCVLVYGWWVTTQEFLSVKLCMEKYSRKYTCLINYLKVDVIIHISARDNSDLSLRKKLRK